MEYKGTINLPKTDFPMKADLPNREPRILKRWEGSGLYAKIREKSMGKERFVLHDGPPYANGSIHMGHALNKILKDIVIRYKTMRGFDSPYVPGWDCHGLPVEHQLFKELKLTKYDIDQVQFRKKARDYAMKYVDIQKREFEQLGIMGYWDRPYLTLSKNYEAAIIRSFGKLVEKGYIYKDLKPVNWCSTCETALAEAEVEYEDKKSESIYVLFEVVSPLNLGVGGKIYFLVWTTTPWTLISNVAVAINPVYEYCLTSFNGKQIIVSVDLLPTLENKLGADLSNGILKRFTGEELEKDNGDIMLQHPFLETQSKVVLADYVSREDGTGCVHIAPGHGEEDFNLIRKYNESNDPRIKIIMNVNEKGIFESPVEFKGMNINDASKNVIKVLEKNHALVKAETITHSYPHCWRCKKPVIFRATEQYFMKIDHDHLRLKMLNAILNNVKWIPQAARSRISAMVTNRPDWCLSRQRYWGVPIIAFYCKGCKEVLLDAGAIEHVASLVDQEGTDAWFIRKEEDLLPKGMKCKSCGGSSFTKETDIIDVWFDSGVSHQAVLRADKELDYPCELYLEGSDQHRGWFQSALITGIAIDNIPPYKNVLTHGFVVDGEGKKMSKSLGNVITPHKVMKKYGADILRLWVASSDYSEDIRISDEILKRLADAYRKIRNTYKYLLSNLYDFDPAKDRVEHSKMLEIDRWILSKLSGLMKKATSDYDSYAFHKVYRDIYNFCGYEVSSVYLDILKDRMYTFRADSIERRSGQTAMFELLTALAKMMAPILAMTTDEAWGYLNFKDKADFIHLESWPENNFDKWHDEQLDSKWAALIAVREEVLKKLEEKRSANEIGSSLEAKVILAAADDDCRKLLTDNKDSLRYLFIVSQVEIEDHPATKGDIAGFAPVSVYIKKADGQKCQRCWNYSESVGSGKDHPALCERCVKAI